MIDSDILQAHASSLAGQHILTRAGASNALRLHIWKEGADSGRIRLLNRLTERSAFTLLHFMFHVDSEVCFHQLVLIGSDPHIPGLQQLFKRHTPFNTALVDVLGGVRRRGVNRRQRGWIHAKFEPLEMDESSQMATFHTVLSEWVCAQWVSTYYAGLLDLQPLLGYLTQGSAHRRVEVDFGLTERSRPELEIEITEGFERLLEHLLHLPPPPAGSARLEQVVFHFPGWWRGWCRRLCSTGCAHDAGEVERDTHAVFHLTPTSLQRKKAGGELRVEVSYEYDERKMSYYWCKQLNIRVCEVTITLQRSVPSSIGV